MTNSVKTCIILFVLIRASLTSLVFKREVLLLLSLLLITPKSDASLKVLTSIKPIYALSASLMSGMATPTLLTTQHWRHRFLLKPSQVAQLYQSDLVITIDKDFEFFLNKILKQIKKTNQIYLSTSPSLTLIQSKSSRPSTNWHLWLNIDNAIVMSEYIAKNLMQKDGVNQKKYQSNLARLVTDLTQYKQTYQQKMFALQDKTIITLSDAYQYYTNQYFKRVITIPSADHHNPIKISQIYQLYQALQSLPANTNTCLIADNPTDIKKIRQLLSNIQHLKFNSITLDPIGQHLPSTHHLYTKLLDEFQTKLFQCFQ